MQNIKKVDGWSSPVIESVTHTIFTENGSTPVPARRLLGLRHPEVCARHCRAADRPHHRRRYASVRRRRRDPRYRLQGQQLHAADAGRRDARPGRGARNDRPRPLLARHRCRGDSFIRERRRVRRRSCCATASSRTTRSSPRSSRAIRWRCRSAPCSGTSSRPPGVTYKTFTQIERAQKAVALLQQGRPAADVAFALGYSDQPHMIRSVKAIMGQTPGQIAGAASSKTVGNLQSRRSGRWLERMQSQPSKEHANDRHHPLQDRHSRSQAGRPARSASPTP